MWKGKGKVVIRMRIEIQKEEGSAMVVMSVIVHANACHQIPSYKAYKDCYVTIDIVLVFLRYQ